MEKRAAHIQICQLTIHSLLSSAGIPKLRRIAKDKLKFKGKGHEFSDISRMLNLYQLWLDDLYPKAKFKDGLAMVEKLGHTKRMQVSRRAWIDESKGFRRREDEDAEMRLGDVAGQAEDNDEIFPIPTRSKESGPEQEQSGGGADAPDDDELDALMGEESAAAAPPSVVANGPTKSQGPFQDDDEPDEDELDALLNEDPRPTVQPTQQTTKSKGPFEDDEDDEDELDALLAEEPQQKQVNGSATGNTSSAQPSRGSGRDDDFADDEEAMAEMGW
jgi:replication fork protection complex subunit Csm3/Swi3